MQQNGRRCTTLWGQCTWLLRRQKKKFSAACCLWAAPTMSRCARCTGGGSWDVVCHVCATQVWVGVNKGSLHLNFEIPASQSSSWEIRCQIRMHEPCTIRQLESDVSFSWGHRMSRVTLFGHAMSALLTGVFTDGSVNRSPTLGSGISYGLGKYGMQSRTSDRSGIGKSIAQNVKDVNENTASSSQVSRQNESTRTSTEKSMAKADQRSDIVKSIAKKHNRLTETRLTHHNVEIFTRPYLEKVFANDPQKLSRQEEDRMLDLKANGIVWRIFMSATMRAAVHLGSDYENNLCITKNTDFEQLKTLFDVWQKLTLKHGSEICGISTTRWHLTSWRKSTLLHDRVSKLSKARVHVYSDSVLCLGKMHAYPAPMERWREQIACFTGSKHH